MPELPVLDLSVLINNYGDDSADTVIMALGGFNREAARYIDLLQQALAGQRCADAATVAHSLKSMAALCGALQLAALCQQIELAARQQDSRQLSGLSQHIMPCWQVLLRHSQAELAARSADER